MHQNYFEKPAIIHLFIRNTKTIVYTNEWQAAGRYDGKAALHREGGIAKRYGISGGERRSRSALRNC